jgi:thiamine phosphate synthase YjbQ (UPF0047 family)
MKSHTEYLWFNTKSRQEFINITPQVEEAVKKSGIKEGLCLDKNYRRIKKFLSGIFLYK